MIVVDLNDYPEGLTCQIIARRLIKAGNHEQTKVCFVRGKTPIFKQFLSLSYFANSKVIESHDGEDMKRIHLKQHPNILTQEKPNGIKSRAA